MEHWIPLLQIFLDSPTPEADAALWLHQHPPPSTPHNSAASAFLSLLETPVSTTEPNSLLWIQTLPPATQSRILSFLAADHRRFCPRRLRSLATHILSSPAPHAFWPRHSAHHLLDVLPSIDSTPSTPFPVEGNEENEFCAMPDWLQAHSSTATPILPWLPIPPSQIPKPALKIFRQKTKILDKEEYLLCSELELSPPDPPPRPLDSAVRDMATVLKSRLLASNSASETVHLSREIRQLCMEAGCGNGLAVLGLIEPWEADDETLSVLLSHLPSDDGLGGASWSSHVLCSVALPKMLSLEKPASRALLSATIGFCKLHRIAAVEALLVPLVLRRGGIGVHLCDVLVRIVKECLHPSHVSAFCQRLLCCKGEDRALVCQPCHQQLISDEVVWTEPLFTLFQHILNHDVHLTSDTVDQIISVVDEMAVKFSRSLKYGNFLLCFITKCPHVLAFHKLLLKNAAKKTDTFVTKSILSKLDNRISS